MVNRRTWLILVSGFFEPLFYLLSIRVGFGDLVGDVTVDGVPIPYAEFVAPALMAASAMNGAVYENTMNVFFKIKHQHLYDAVLATPMMPGDVALGEIGWAVSRGLIYSTAFMLTMWALGMVGSPWIVLAVPACALIGFAFGADGHGADDVHALVGRLRVRHDRRRCRCSCSRRRSTRCRATATGPGSCS